MYRARSWGGTLHGFLLQLAKSDTSDGAARAKIQIISSPRFDSLPDTRLKGMAKQPAGYVLHGHDFFFLVGYVDVNLGDVLVGQLL